MQLRLWPLLLAAAGHASSRPEQTITPRAVARSASDPDITASSIPPSICGWFRDGGFESRWAYVEPTVTCFWNSDAKFVGNANPPQTACVGEKAQSTWSCDGSGCSSSVARCSGAKPYCVTMHYGDDYLSYVCSEEEDQVLDFEPYFSGFDVPIAFPVYTGSEGISTGTQYPDGFPTPTSTDVTTSPRVNSQEPSSSAQDDSASSSPESSSENHGGEHVPVKAIAGGVVGGLVGISLIVGVVVYFAVLRPRAHRRKASSTPKSGTSRHGYVGSQPYEKPELDATSMQPTYSQSPPSGSNQHNFTHPELPASGQRFETYGRPIHEAP